VTFQLLIVLAYRFILILCCFFLRLLLFSVIPRPVKVLFRPLCISICQLLIGNRSCFEAHHTTFFVILRHPTFFVILSSAKDLFRQLLIGNRSCFEAHHNIFFCHPAPSNLFCHPEPRLGSLSLTYNWYAVMVRNSA